MLIFNSDNIVSFKGRVYYANKLSRDYAPKYRDILHQLKHNTANNELSHHIYLNQFKADKAFCMKIVTKYVHEKRVDGFDTHELEHIYVGNDLGNAKAYFLDKIKKINSWKKSIDKINSQEGNNTLTPKMTSVWTKIRKRLHL